MCGGAMLQGDELAERLLAPPVRVEVCGRAGVGRSTLIGALVPRLAAAGVAAELIEGTATNTPASGDADSAGDGHFRDCELVLYVLTDRVLDSDRQWLSTLGDRLSLVVLNKADTLPAGLPAGLSDLPGPVLPTVAGLGRASVDAAALSAEDRELLHEIAAAGEMPVDAEQFLSAGSEQEQARRRSLLERWDLYGIGCVVSALRSGPSGGAGSASAADDAALFARMSQWSGVDAVVARLAVLADRARSLRVDRYLRELDVQAADGARRDAIERLLRAEAADLRVATVLDRRHEPRTSGAAIEIAGRWRERAHAAADTAAWRSAMDQHRRYAALAARLRSRETAPGA